jgi:hypothetical protein
MNNCQVFPFHTNILFFRNLNNPIMKNKLMTIILMLLVIGCNKDYTLNATFEVINNSSHIVHLKVFGVWIQNLSEYSIDTIYFLNQGSAVKYFYDVRTGNKSADDLNIDPFMDADSAQIIFDDKYRISYDLTNSNPRNILRKSSYTGGKTEKLAFSYFYYISDDDYKNAVMIK